MADDTEEQPTMEDCQKAANEVTRRCSRRPPIELCLNCGAMMRIVGLRWAQSGWYVVWRCPDCKKYFNSLSCLEEQGAEAFEPVAADAMIG